ncbi:resolvase [Macrococcus hajekii]|uniref:Resolvase n=1 Tax=Macrococcus hajekii TaxID=198482 RepID=A0A4R6BK39_9STAP|nr:recombinase family protein [Macrococcus hajekii]TDM02010.1 resolvase [Macrococcus hajekii]GGB09325.1 resolvase [Macrococcus hajekii]
MKYGYIRPIDLKDTEENQMKKLNSLTEEIFKENHAKNKNRKVLDELLKQLKEDDELIVTDLFILADSTKHLSDIINMMKDSNFKIHVYNTGIVINRTVSFNFIDTLEIITQFQTDVVRFRTKQGISKSREEGKQIGRPKRSDDNLDRAIKMYLSKSYTLDEIKEKTNISRATLYRHLDK